MGLLYPLGPSLGFLSQKDSRIVHVNIRACVGRSALIKCTIVLTKNCTKARTSNI